MFRYYQTGEKSTWQVISDSPQVIDRVLELGGVKVTILAVSEVFDKDTDSSDIKYKGPFYADIDIKGDIGQAARSTASLVDKLILRGVPQEQIQVFASGSKGFHVLVDEHIFSAGRSSKSLPAVYREMALHLYVTGLDMQVYCGGRGNCWRIENAKRFDGNYRVRVTIEELRNLVENPSLYQGLVSSPRDLPPPPKVTERSPECEALYNASRGEATKKSSTPDPIESAKLKDLFSGTLPQCVADIREGKLRATTNFNKSALAAATFISRSGMAETDSVGLITRMAENAKSSSYDSNAQREEHIGGLVKYVGAVSKYQFSCAVMLGIVNTKPCEGCALQGSGRNLDGGADDLGVVIIDGSYYRDTGREPIRLSTFVVNKQSEIRSPTEDNPHISETSGVLCNIVTLSGQTYSKLFPETAWKSKAGLLTVLEGMPEAVFLGNDLDVQKMKYLILNDGEDMDQIHEVISAGIHFDRQYSNPLPVYVEPGLSTNKFGVQGTHVLNRNIPHPPSLQSIDVGEASIEKSAKAFELLLKINSTQAMALLIGWFSAAHFKTHTTSILGQFPLLSVWGNSGSGKTSALEIVMWLSGVGSKSETISMHLPHATKFPIIEYGTTTTTIPRVFEEFNKSKMDAKMYAYVHEFFKAAFDGGSASRGTVGRASNASISKGINAKVVSIEITSPIVYVSEQPVESTPLKQRSVPVSMNSLSRDLGTKAFKELYKTQEDLAPIAKLLTLKALQMSPDEVNKYLERRNMDHYTELENRNNTGLQVTMAGLDLLKATLKEAKYPARTVRLLENLIKDVTSEFDSLVQEVGSRSSKSEVDMVLEDMALMAYIQNSMTMDGLEEGKHFFIEGDRLLLDVIVSHSLYKRYKRSEGGSHRLAIESPTQMMVLLKLEHYWVSDQSIPQDKGVGGKRRMVELDMAKMRTKGIDTNLFSGE